MKKTKKSSAGMSIGSLLVTFVAYFGGYVINTFWIIVACAGKGIAAFFKTLWRLTNNLRRRAYKALRKIGAWFAAPFKKTAKSFQTIGREIVRAKERQGFKEAFRVTMKNTGKLLFGKKSAVVTVFNYAAPIISVFFLFSVVTYANSINYAVKLTVNGQFIGYIENEQVFSDAEKVMRERIDYIGGDIDIEVTPSFSIEPIGYSETLNQYQIADLMLQNSGVSLEYAYGFYINDTFYGALTDYRKVEQTLEKLLDQYRTDNTTETVAFVDNISYNRAGLFLTDSIIDEDWLIELISGVKTVSRYYEVVYGDSHYLIGDKIDMTQAEIEALNPGFIESDLRVGDLIKMNAEEPFLSVSISKTESYDVNVAYETEYYDDSSIYEGSSRTTREGQYGVNHVTAQVTYVNGVETSREILTVSKVSDPVSQLVAVGTKPTPQGTFSDATAAYGKLIWPTGYGEISQLTCWEGGYYNHVGIDISAIGYGAPVYAGAAGVVTFAGWNGGYGYMVKIYHPDLGIYTYYAHNSALYVTTGETVAQGQCIAGAGATGTAQGIHIHLEVRNANGVALNPMNYVDVPSWVKIYNW